LGDGTVAVLPAHGERVDLAAGPAGPRR